MQIYIYALIAHRKYGEEKFGSGRNNIKSLIGSFLCETIAPNFVSSHKDGSFWSKRSQLFPIFLNKGLLILA